MPAVRSSGAEAAGGAQAADPAAWSLVEAAAALREGRVDAQGYARVLLGRCEAGAHLNAFSAQDAAALLAAARAADAARKQGLPIGPLHGLPIAVKDNIDAVPYPTTAGTEGLRHLPAPRHATVVDRLLRAGALVAGKTTMHELAMGWTGQNAAFGDTRNPHDPGRIAGGSSGGSACAVAANLVPGAIGTDTNGSIRVPSAFCGIVGLRPSHGRYPMDGVVPLAPSLDTAGPMARRVADVALLDALMAGLPVEPLGPPDAHTLRLGVCRGWFWERLDDEVAQAADQALERLRRHGVACIAIDLPQLSDLLDDAAPAIIGHEAGRALAAFLRARADAPALAQVLAAVASDLAPAAAGLAGADPDAPRYRAAAARRERLRSLWAGCFARHRLDALVHPAARVTAPPLQYTRISPAPGVLTRWGWMQAREAFAQNVTPASLAGAPSIVLPVRGGQALPVGLQLDGVPGGDRRLLSVAAAVESLLPPGD
jgi:mandelamide amidase